MFGSLVVLCGKEILNEAVTLAPNHRLECAQAIDALDHHFELVLDHCGRLFGEGWVRRCFGRVRTATGVRDLHGRDLIGRAQS